MKVGKTSTELGAGAGNMGREMFFILSFVSREVFSPGKLTLDSMRPKNYRRPSRVKRAHAQSYPRGGRSSARIPAASVSASSPASAPGPALACSLRSPLSCSPALFSGLHFLDRGGCFYSDTGSSGFLPMGV